MMKIGEKLKEIRKECGYSQQEMSLMLDMAKNSYGSYERNNSIPSVENFVKLAGILHTSVQYLITGKELSAEFQEESTSFTERLRELRKKNHLTQAEVANVLEIRRETYRGYEAGDYEPKLDKLLILADLYQVTLDELMGRNRK